MISKIIEVRGDHETDGGRTMNIRALFARDENITKYIRENRAFAEKCGYDPDKLHCNGCVYSCPLSHTKCVTGEKAAGLLEKVNK